MAARCRFWWPFFALKCDSFHELVPSMEHLLFAFAVHVTVFLPAPPPPPLLLHGRHTHSSSLVAFEEGAKSVLGTFATVQRLLLGSWCRNATVYETLANM